MRRLIGRLFGGFLGRFFSWFLGGLVTGRNRDLFFHRVAIAGNRDLAVLGLGTALRAFGLMKGVGSGGDAVEARAAVPRIGVAPLGAIAVLLDHVAILDQLPTRAGDGIALLIRDLDDQRAGKAIDDLIRGFLGDGLLGDGFIRRLFGDFLGGLLGERYDDELLDIASVARDGDLAIVGEVRAIRTRDLAKRIGTRRNIIEASATVSRVRIAPLGGVAIIHHDIAVLDQLPAGSGDEVALVILELHHEGAREAFLLGRLFRHFIGRFFRYLLGGLLRHRHGDLLLDGVAVAGDGDFAVLGEIGAFRSFGLMEGVGSRRHDVETSAAVARVGVTPFRAVALFLNHVPVLNQLPAGAGNRVALLVGDLHDQRAGETVIDGFVGRFIRGLVGGFVRWLFDDLRALGLKGDDLVAGLEIDRGVGHRLLPGRRLDLDEGIPAGLDPFGEGHEGVAAAIGAGLVDEASAPQLVAAAASRVAVRVEPLDGECSVGKSLGVDDVSVGIE